MKLKYRNRIYISLILILVVCIINVLTGMYELMSSDYNVTANQIIWNGARYNRDENGYKRIDNLENLVEYGQWQVIMQRMMSSVMRD